MKAVTLFALIVFGVGCYLIWYELNKVGNAVASVSNQVTGSIGSATGAIEGAPAALWAWLTSPFTAAATPITGTPDNTTGIFQMSN